MRWRLLPARSAPCPCTQHICFVFQGLIPFLTDNNIRKQISKLFQQNVAIKIQSYSARFSHVLTVKTYSSRLKSLLWHCVLFISLHSQLKYKALTQRRCQNGLYLSLHWQWISYHPLNCELTTNGVKQPTKKCILLSLSTQKLLKFQKRFHSHFLFLERVGFRIMYMLVPLHNRTPVPQTHR